MGKARIRSKHSKVFITDLNGNDILVGEIDSLTEKSLDELVTSQPMGETGITSHTDFKGWELTFEGGKVDTALASLIHSQDKQISKGGRSPYFKVRQCKTFFNGDIEEWIYENVTLHGYEVNSPNQDALSEKFMGFSGVGRTLGESAVGVESQDSLLTKILSKMAEKPKYKGNDN